MDLQYLLSESELLEHTASFGFSLKAGEKELKRQLQGPWISSRSILEEKASDILRLRDYPDLYNIANTTFQNLKESEKLLLSHVPSETSKSAEGQIFFTGTDTKPLNHIPFFITILVFLKIWVAPILALFTPLILLIMPYVILTSVMDMNITWELYIVMMKHMVFGIQNGEPWRIKHYGQALWTGVSLLQGIITPFVTSYHTSKLDAILVKRSEALSKIHKDGSYILSLFKEHGIMKEEQYQFPEIPTEVHEVVAWMEEEPLGMLQIWRTLGRMCVLTQIASDGSWYPVIWSNSSNTLSLTNLYDIAIPETRARTSDLNLVGHSLLTGPNRGGKSSCLRAILQQVLLGQTFGFTKNAIGSWSPFRLVFTRLKSRDSAGKESLFEMEVRMASKILSTSRSMNCNTLVLIDELFHSTNPPDAETSAKVFLKGLWKLPYCKSIISTHIFSLCESVPDKIQTLCCPANMGPFGKLVYSYELKPGICRMSSVQEVLEESGLYA
jgi:hypothetical protein